MEERLLDGLAFRWPIKLQLILSQFTKRQFFCRQAALAKLA